jgi:hypothetical protein
MNDYEVRRVTNTLSWGVEIQIRVWVAFQTRELLKARERNFSLKSNGELFKI